MRNSDVALKLICDSVSFSFQPVVIKINTCNVLFGFSSYDLLSPGT